MASQVIKPTTIKRSLELWEEAQYLMPGGTQLLGRRPQLYAFGVTPILAERAEGAYFWDVDGNRYLDTSMSLGAVLLGYCDPEVENAVDEQRKKGTIFPILHPVEIEMARLVTEVVPCAEMVRFGKSGGEADAVAVRIARGFTGRDKVAFCGYHGWHDWYISANLADPRSLESHLLPGVDARGIPKALLGTSIPFEYNNIDYLKRVFDDNKNQIACVIMEASRSYLPNEGYLAKVKDVTQENGALLIFDEVVTGFRLSLGGAQQYYGVTPDLATFGKAIANGYALTAIAGRRDVMEFSKELFISSLFWDDASTLAAGVATIKKMKREKPAEKIAALGRRYMREWQRLADCHKVPAKVVGNPHSSTVVFEQAGSISQRQLLTLYIQEMAKRGVFTGTGLFNVSLAHGDKELDELLGASAGALAVVGEAVQKGNIREYLEAEEQRPLFARRMV
jgi:glutamate-1-semialdehyde 2,1-aminomutase